MKGRLILPLQPRKRRHRATGRKPPGGDRPGAGRKKGTKDSRPREPHGTAVAIEALKHRIPEGTPPELEKMANTALRRIWDVMEQLVPYQHAPSVLKAAGMTREEICGPVTQRLDLSGSVNVTVKKYGPEDL